MGSNLIFLHVVNPIFPTPFIEETLISPLSLFGSFVKY